MSDCKIVSLSGFRGSGKNTVSKILQEKYGFVEFSFSTALKDIISVLFNWDRELVEGVTDESRKFRKIPDLFWSDKLGYEVTPEKMLTKIGTDLFRNHLNKEFWIYVIENKLRSILNNKRIVIERCSYKNELEFIKGLNGICVWVDKEKPIWYNEAQIANEIQDENFRINFINHSQLKCVHDSEYSLVGYEFDWIIYNSDDLEHLKNQVIKFTSYKLNL